MDGEDIILEEITLSGIEVHKLLMSMNTTFVLIWGNFYCLLYALQNSRAKND